LQLAALVTSPEVFDRSRVDAANLKLDFDLVTGRLVGDERFSAGRCPPLRWQWS
jgi:hypothetical protein